MLKPAKERVRPGRVRGTAHLGGPWPQTGKKAGTRRMCATGVGPQKRGERRGISLISLSKQGGAELWVWYSRPASRLAAPMDGHKLVGSDSLNGTRQRNHTPNKGAYPQMQNVRGHRDANIPFLMKFCHGIARPGKGLHLPSRRTDEQAKAPHAVAKVDCGPTAAAGRICSPSLSVGQGG